MRTEVTRAIAAQRGDLAEMLAGLSEEQWDAGTLCAGWRVREVVAHVTRLPAGLLSGAPATRFTA
ncbi:maleylpyruvate isomerase N-terminal domain-containing protein [Actinoplanes oblitus]|uniref:Maleylpyruvate isomerase N-terminal domain-containing protein n=1 Tax=Actinoplanes oblitus TaxID=3040509 RepID=A0ABY8WD33_9ACTN|nr:maleylpyruvate isomerase N-terminal domain-containing protein [Actinoplanes oblitus]WIM93630.1 maleylpyruvate isomerase N-terminal domain-containing protein [Actinoplanes oblitus]